MSPNRRTQCERIVISGVALLAFLVILAVAAVASAGEIGEAGDLAQMRAQLNDLKSHAALDRNRVERDEQLIRRLEDRLEAIEARDAKLTSTTKTIEIDNSKLKTETEKQLAQIQDRLNKGISTADFDNAIDRYAGQHQFTFAGTAAGDFIYDRKTSTNTFSLLFEPIALYRLNDWMLFEGTIEAALPNGSSADFQLPVATAQIFLNDYMEINAGIFDQPFGDWYEDQSPVWVNRFITAPLPYGAEPVVPPTDVGVQLRGSVQWGMLGQDIDYTSWIANGPSFDPALPQPVIGQTLNPQNNIAVNSNGRAFGTRIRLYPLPLDENLGRLEVGGSTYDGKWLNSHWFNAWGIDFAYLNGNLQARGEFAQTYRQMPSGSNPDNRQGWYVQAGYFLQGLPSMRLGDRIDDAIHHLELLSRYSGVNQRAIVADEISIIPQLGFNGSPSIFQPHAREVALGIDYWIEPSIVWQTEVDFELPGVGGQLIAFDSKGKPIASPINATPNDRALLTQLAIGF